MVIFLFTFIMSTLVYTLNIFLFCIYSIISIIILTIVLCAWHRDERINDALDPVEAAQCNNFWDKILKSFSVQNNWKSLMDDTIPPNSISVINGIKYES